MAILLVSLTQSTKSYAKDFGVMGEQFIIEEPDMLEVINNKLQVMESTGVLVQKQKEMISITEKYVERPTPLDHISKSKHDKSWLHDPSYIVAEDISDHRGRIIHKKGEIINPLDTQKLRHSLIFINGDDIEQVEWALKFSPKGTEDKKIILVNGSPTDLMKKYKTRFYFDQKGIITQRLGVKNVPAYVEQSDNKLKITETSLHSSKS